MDAADAKVLGVYEHFTVHSGGGDQLLGMEAQDVCFAAFHLQTVHQEVVVEYLGRCRYGVGNFQAEHGQGVLIEIGVEDVGAGELAQGVFLVKTGDPVGQYLLPVCLAVLGVSGTLRVGVGTVIIDECP